MKSLDPIPIEEIRAAQRRISELITRTPLLRLNVFDGPAEIYLKLENLQPIGSFKLRGAGNAMLSASAQELAQGVWTASAGNMAQGVAWCARQMGIRCTVVVPDYTPEAKLAAIARLGGKILKLPYSEWLEVFATHVCEGVDGLFVHPFADPAVVAGNGTIGLEILEDLPDVDAVVTPYSGGGLACGIALALRVLQPDINVYACEVETAAPLAASLAAGVPVRVERAPSFVDIGAPHVFPEMWHLSNQLFDGSLVASLVEIADAIRLLVQRNCVVAEGAGAISVATALAGKAGGGKVVCVVSGGNIDAAKLARILQGEIP